MKWHRVSAICSIMALGFFWPWAGVAVAQESTPRNPDPAKASQQEAVKSSQVLRLTLQDALALAEKIAYSFKLRRPTLPCSPRPLSSCYRVTSEREL